MRKEQYTKLFPALAVLAAVTLLLLPEARAQEAQEAGEGQSTQESQVLVIYGTVRTDDGAPVVGTRVELSYISSTEVTPTNNQSPERNMITAETDAQGDFELTFLYTPTMTDLRLAVVSMTVDTFRYAVPRPLNVQDRIRNAVEAGDRRVRFNWTIQTRPTWEDELAEMQKYGQDSDKGRLIRLRGLPDQVRRFVRPDGITGEIWVYYKAGIAVRFIEGRRDKDFYFRPRP